jgi:hypothetical protein
MGLAVLGVGVLLLLLSLRLRGRTPRLAGQGAAVLIAFAGLLLVLRGPGSALQLPGHGPRRWHSP